MATGDKYVPYEVWGNNNNFGGCTFYIRVTSVGNALSCPSFDALLRYFKEIFRDDMTLEWANIKERSGISLV